MKMLINKDDILKKIRKRPTDALALGRTILANERTLLGFVRTSVGLLAAGVGLIKFLSHPAVVLFGWMLIFFSLGFLVWGIWRYRNINQLLKDVSDEIE